MKNLFKQVQSSKVWAGKSTPKANWADDKFVYACQNLITSCTAALREGAGAVGNEVAAACSQAVVCASVAISCFTYYDEASLAERIGACNELSACCELLAGALASADFDGAKNCLEAAQACFDLCALTAGSEQEESDGPAHSENETAEMAAPAAAAAKPVAKLNPNWLTIVAKADSFEMSVNGFIGASVEDNTGVSGKEFAEALAKIPKGKHVKLRINSEGGSVADGLQIYNLLKERRPDVTSYIDGVALSAASLIALAAEQVISPVSSVWMIHSPRLGTYGDTEEHKKSIKMLKTFTDMMADVYSEETGKPKDEILSDMESETWLTGAEAIEYGLATATEEDDSDEAQDTDNEPDARYHAHAVLAMYRPPEKVRQIISARNGAGGKTNAGTAASKTENENMEKQTNPVAAAPTASPTLEQRFVQERKMRISGEVNRRAEGKINNSNLNWWIDQAMDAPTAEAEQAIYAQLDAMPKAAAPGGEAVRPDKVEAVASGRTPIFELPLAHGCVPRANKRLDWMEETRKIKSRADRIMAMKKDWAAKLDYCYQLDAKESKGLPQAANTYSSTLITDFLVDQAITILVARFAALSSFSIEFGPDRYKEYATGQTKFVVSAGSTIKGTKSSPITNFQQGDGTIVPISLPMTHYVKSFNVSQEDMMSGLRVENLMQLNLLQFTKDITLDALQPIAGAAANTQIPGPLNSSGVVANYSAGTIHINAGTFGWNVGQTDGHDLASLWAYLKNSPEKNLILDGNFYGRLTNSPGYFQPTFGDEKGGGDRVKTFGWDRIEENTVWPAITDSASNAIGGLACNRQAILGVTGLPMTPPSIPGGVLQETVVTLDNGLSVSMFTWFELGTRKIWNSFELMGAFAGGDASAAAVIFNGKGSIS